MNTAKRWNYIPNVIFRPCAMVVPDFELICEIMLVAEGFQDARLLARKFITLYMLCRELLSKQDHYDWGLRAIKSVLVVAGSLKVRFVYFNNKKVSLSKLKDKLYRIENKIISYKVMSRKIFTGVHI